MTNKEAFKVLIGVSISIKNTNYDMDTLMEGDEYCYLQYAIYIAIQHIRKANKLDKHTEKYNECVKGLAYMRNNTIEHLQDIVIRDTGYRSSLDSTYNNMNTVRFFNGLNTLKSILLQQA